MILVTGATGNVGRHVAVGLAERGAEVRTSSRGGGDVPADLSDPGRLDQALDGVDSVFLVWPGPAVPGIAEAVATITARVRKVVYLSAAGAEHGFWGEVEKAVEHSGVEWVFLRPGGFATNTLGWAGMIRDDGVVRWPYGEARRALIHERDIADVAVTALLSGALDGRRPHLTGPANLTQVEQVRLIGEAIGRDVRWVELPREDARQQLLAEWGNEGFVDASLTYWASLVGTGEPVTEDVAHIIGRPARAFRDWCSDHAADFR
ncbi:NAD(P)H-binding protein [Actinoplanes sp. NPDC051470]|uniref:NAD(P)H-binding protein n=1 Tax=unclassified Actinoplanes TaxID=2626549 RepID=UPI003415F84E